MNTNMKWQENYIQHLTISFLFSGAISALIFVILSRFLSLPLFAFYLGGVILWLSITYTIFNHDGFKKSCTYKGFLTEVKTAKRVVENVLNSKNLPYTQTNRGFILDTIEIRIGYGGRQGTIIAIGPYQGSNRPIVESLKKKIDEAFLPQGLNLS